MPFTLSHAAAALPFRRSRLVLSALLMGAFAPDLEYFIRLQAGGGWGHTVAGALGMSLPLGLITLWIFHRFVKVPAVYLLPDSLGARLTFQLAPFRWSPAGRFLLIVVSMLVGIGTHLIWDGFTHPQYWGVRHMPVLWRLLHIPIVGWTAWYSLLQTISSIAGLAILALWCLRWYRRATPGTQISTNPFTSRQRLVIALIGMAAAMFGAAARAYIGVGVPTNHYEWTDFLDQMIVTCGALIWWQLAMWGLLGPFRHDRSARAEQPVYAQSQTSLER